MNPMNDEHEIDHGRDQDRRLVTDRHLEGQLLEPGQSDEVREDRQADDEHDVEVAVRRSPLSE